MDPKIRYPNFRKLPCKPKEPDGQYAVAGPAPSEKWLGSVGSGLREALVEAT